MNVADHLKPSFAVKPKFRYIFLSINYKIVKKFLYLPLLLNILLQYAFFFSESMSIWINTRLVEANVKVFNSHLMQTTIFTFIAVLFKKVYFAWNCFSRQL